MNSNPPRKSFFSRLFNSRKKKWAWVLVSFPFIIVLCLGIFLNSIAFKTILLKKVNQRLSRQLGLTLSIEELDSDWGKLSFRIGNLLIQAEDPDRAPISSLKIREVDLDLAWKSVFTRKIIVQRLHITEPLVVLAPELPQPGPPNKGEITPQKRKKAQDFLIRDFRISGWGVQYDGINRNMSLSLRDISVMLDYQPAMQIHKGAFMLGSGYVVSDDRRIEITALNAEFLFDSENLILDRLRVETEPAWVEVSGSISDYQTEPEFDLNVKGDINAGFLKSILRLKEEWRGDLSFAGRFSGTPADWDFTSELRAEEISAADIKLTAVTADLTADPRTVHLNRFFLQTQSGSMQGEGIWSLEKTNRSHISLNWDGIDLAIFKPFLPADFPGINSYLEGNIRMEWTSPVIDDVQGEGTLHFRSRSGWEEGPALDGKMHFLVNGGNVELLPSFLDIEGIRLNLSGRLDNSGPIEGGIQLSLMDLSRFQASLKSFSRYFPDASMDRIFEQSWKGNLIMKGRLSGSMPDPELAFQWEGSDIFFGDLTVPAFSGSIKSANNLLQVESFSIQTGKGEFSLHGRVEYNFFDQVWGKDSDLIMEWKDIDLSEFSGLLPPSLSPAGKTWGRIHLSGTPQSPWVQMEGSLKEGSFQGETLDLFELSLESDGPDVQLTRLELKKGKGFLKGEGDFNYESGEYSIDFSGSGFELSDFSILNSQGDQTAGSFELALQGKGSVDQPSFRFQAVLKNLKKSEFFLEWIKIDALSEGKDARIQLLTPGDFFTIESMLQLSPPFSLTSTLTVRDFNFLEKFFVFAGREVPDSSSNLTARAVVSLDLNDMTRLEGFLDITDFALAYQTASIRNEQPIRLEFRDGILRVNDWKMTGPETSMMIAGYLPIASGSRGSLRAEGNLDLILLEPFIPGSKIGGIWNFMGEIQGSLEKPEVQAKTELKDGMLVAPALPYAVKNATLLASLAGSELKLERFSLPLEGGEITAQGAWPLSGRFSAGNGEEISKSGSISINLKEIDLSPLFKDSPENIRDSIGGRLNGSFLIREDRNSRMGITLEGALDKIELDMADFHIESPEPVRIDFSGDVLILQDFVLSGESVVLSGGGRVTFSGEPEISAGFSLTADSAMLTPFMESGVLGGLLSIEMKIDGTAASPVFAGTAAYKQGFFQMEEISFLATDLSGDLSFTPGRIDAELSGLINGGPVKGNGFIDLSGFEIKNAGMTLSAANIQLTYPEGLQAVTRGKILLEGKSGQWMLSGDINIDRSFYTANIYPGNELWNNLRFRRVRSLRDIPPALRGLNLDVRVKTGEPFILENNLAELQMEGSLNIKGTPIDLQYLGYFSNHGLGKIVFGNRSFEVERVGMEFPGRGPMDANLDLVAHTQMKHQYDQLDITLSLSGPVQRLNYSLSSSPPRSQAELAALLITGYGTERLKTDTVNVIGNQMLLYFTTPLASPLTGRIRDLLGAEEVIIEPINIASEEDPGARFTFRKGLIRNLDIIYSIDVSDTQQQTWVLDYSLNRNLSVQSFRKDDGTYGSSMSHRFYPRDLLFRSQNKDSASASRTIHGQVEFVGNPVFSSEELSGLLRGLKPGKRFHYRDLRDSINALVEFYKSEDYLSVVVDPAVGMEKDRYASVQFTILPNRKSQMFFSGDPVPAGLKRDVIRNWNGRLPETMVLNAARSLVLRYYHGKGYYDVEVQADKRSVGNEIHYSLNIRQGLRYRIGEFSLEGESRIAGKEIRRELAGFPRGRRGLWALIYDYPRARARIRDFYAELGYLDPSIKRPKIQIDSLRRRIDIILPLDAGERSRILGVEIKGYQNLGREQLLSLLELKAGAIYRPSFLSEDHNRLLNIYRESGFQDALIQVEIIPEEGTPDLRLAYSIDEGRQHRIKEIRISGNRRTSETMIRRQLDFEVGDEVNIQKLILSQKRLYDLGIFRNIRIHRIGDSDAPENEIIGIDLEEEPTFAIGYGLRFSSEEKFEGFGRLELTNLFGHARNGLVYYRQNQRQKDFRFSLKDPFLFGRRFNTLHTLSYKEDLQSIFMSEELGYTFQQEVKLPFQSTLSYLYKLSRIHTYELESFGPFPFDIELFFSEVQTYVLRDTRINKLNAQQGSFFSLSFTYSPAFLGSDLTYISFFGQHSFYRRLVPGLVWASNVRIGLADAFDQYLVPSKRFYAGGGNSLRGFKRDLVGPIDPFFGDSLGGESLLLINQELRFSFNRWLGGVVFYDTGNVYENLSDFRPWDLRHGLGLGIRLNLPIALLRLDYGFNLSPRVGESRRVFYFSIGQSF